MKQDFIIEVNEKQISANDSITPEFYELYLYFINKYGENVKLYRRTIQEILEEI